jgi:hypothetical protein
MLDLEALLLRLRKLQSINLTLDDEKAAIGQRLEQLLEGQQWLSNDRGHNL